MNNEYRLNGGSFKGFDICDKTKSIRWHIDYMLNRTQSMIDYEGLPETIPKRELILLLQCNGWVCIPDPSTTGGKLYAVDGNLSGVPDPYYMPTQCVVANVGLNLSRTYDIDKDCVIVPHDSMYKGLIPLFARYASLLIENEITMRVAIINQRISGLITAPDDATVKAAKQYLEDIEAGKLAVIGDNAFLDGIKTQPYGQTAGGNLLSQIIETEQYLKAGWYNDLGLRANYNMKREAINSQEAQLDDDALLPLIDNIISTQQTAFDKVNQKYGTNIRVKLGSAWEDRQEEGETDETAGSDSDVD